MVKKNNNKEQYNEFKNRYYNLEFDYLLPTKYKYSTLIHYPL